MTDDEPDPRRFVCGGCFRAFSTRRRYDSHVGRCRPLARERCIHGLPTDGCALCSTRIVVPGEDLRDER